MRKVISTTAFLSLASLISPFSTYAVDFCPAGQFDVLCKLNVDDNASIVSNIIQILLVIAALAALFFLIYGGIRWITSAGDKAKVGEARATLTAAVVGLIITFLAFFILNVVAGLFGLDSNALFTLPRLINE